MLSKHKINIPDMLIDSSILRYIMINIYVGIFDLQAHSDLLMHIIFALQ